MGLSILVVVREAYGFSPIPLPVVRYELRRRFQTIAVASWRFSRKPNTVDLHNLRFQSYRSVLPPKHINDTGYMRDGLSLRLPARFYSYRGNAFARRTSEWSRFLGNTPGWRSHRLHNYFIRMLTFNFTADPTYYPVGNTPATFLLQSLPPEQDANVLLMGCGDPRSILFTAYNVQDDGPRSVDFTCCDIQPAILARNILLLSLILDDRNGEHSQKHWNIFYHFRIDSDSLSLIYTQARKLFDLSLNIDIWHGSIYGPVFRMVSQDTLLQLRSLWQKYFETNQCENFNAKFLDGWHRTAKASRDNDKRKGTINATGLRAWGPLSSIRSADHANQHYINFWDTGVAAGNSHDLASAKNPNPIFLYTLAGDNFIVHDGSDPVLGYHLEMAVVDVLENGPFGEVSNISKSRAKTTQQLMDRIAQVAKIQFKEWCKAFRKIATGGRLVVRFYLGDALRFCRSLEICREKGPDTALFDYTQAWRAAPLKLDGGDYKASSSCFAPMSFDVIETSNLTDHVGLLNILVAATPLLSSRPSSILYTETFNGKGEAHNGELARLLSGDVVTMSLLLGLAPLGYLTGTIPGSSAQESIGRGVEKDSSRYIRISWKKPILGDETALKWLGNRSEPRCAINFVELTGVLLNIYIFKLTTETYAELLRLVQRRVDTDWPRLMMMINNIIASHDSENYMELFTHLHQSGIYNPKDITNQLGIFPKSSISNIVTVVLKVPRSKFELVAGIPRTLFSTIESDKSRHLFSSLQIVFGRLVLSRGGSKATIVQDMDATDLIVSFSVPKVLLPQKHRDSVLVTLQAGCNPSIGDSNPLAIHTSTLSNKDEVTVLHVPPGISSLRPKASPSPPSTTQEKYGAQISAYFNEAAQVEKFYISVDYHPSTAESKALQKITEDELTVSQDSPCTLTIKIPGSDHHKIAFPYPVNGSRMQYTLSKKLFLPLSIKNYIEISVPPSRPIEGSGFNLKAFPIVNGQPPIVWDIPRVNLDRLPILDTTRKDNTDSWLLDHLSCMYSDRERQMTTPDTKLNLKHTIASILINAAGTMGPKHQVFSISSPGYPVSQFLIFVDNIRLDLGSRTVVADARFLPLTDIIRSTERHALEVLQDKGIHKLPMENAELECWREILPTLVERCRSWKHTALCEYRKYGIPVSAKVGESPLCSCGVGKGPKFLGEFKEWKPFEKYWTRAAIAPIFAFPYAESCEMAIKDLQNFKDAFKVEKDENARKSGRRVADIYKQPTKVDKSIPKKFEQAPRAEIGTASSNGKIDTPTVSTARSLPKGLCQRCGRKPDTGKLLGCRKCGKVKYCSVACQKADWKHHKGVCKK